MRGTLGTEDLAGRNRIGLLPIEGFDQQVAVSYERQVTGPLDVDTLEFSSSIDRYKSSHGEMNSI